MTAPLPARRPDALDLFEAIALATHEIRNSAWYVFQIGDGTKMERLRHEQLAALRAAANRVLAALDAYEART